MRAEPHRRTRVRRSGAGSVLAATLSEDTLDSNKELHMRTLIAVTVTIWIVVLAAAAVG